MPTLIPQSIDQKFFTMVLYLFLPHLYILLLVRDDLKGYAANVEEEEEANAVSQEEGIDKEAVWKGIKDEEEEGVKDKDGEEVEGNFSCLGEKDVRNFRGEERLLSKDNNIYCAAIASARRRIWLALPRSLFNFRP